MQERTEMIEIFFANRLPWLPDELKFIILRFSGLAGPGFFWVFMPRVLRPMVTVSAREPPFRRRFR